MVCVCARASRWWACTAGVQTVCDMHDVWHTPLERRNCNVATRMDVPAFWELMIAALRRANERSPLNLVAVM